MSRPNRAQVNDEYNISDWYSASRKSRALSVMQQHPSHYQQSTVVEPLPQYQSQPRQQPIYTQPSVHAGGDNYTGVVDNQGQVYQSQGRPRTQQQRHFAPTADNVHASGAPYTPALSLNRPHYDPPLPHAPEAQFNPRAPVRYNRPMTAGTLGYSQRPVTAGTLGYSQRPVTASTVGSGLAMGTSLPANLRQSKSRQELLQCYGVSPVAEKALYLDAPSALTVYVPPARPTTAAVQLSRNKSLNDGYSKRRAGGDSGMGECCESCCGGCMRCACISACCCLSPIISWLLTLLVLVGIALALYFNWGRITGALNKNNSSTTASPTGVPPALPTTPIDDLVHTANSLLGAVLANMPAPAPTA